MSYLKAKIKRPVFQKDSTKLKDRELYNVLLGFVYSAIFLPKRQCQVTSRTKLKKKKFKNIKMKPPVALFKKKSKKLSFFLKP